MLAGRRSCFLSRSCPSSVLRRPGRADPALAAGPIATCSAEGVRMDLLFLQADHLVVTPLEGTRLASCALPW